MVSSGLALPASGCSARYLVATRHLACQQSLLGPASRGACIAGGQLKGVLIDDAQLLNDRLQEWEDFYNYHRPHGSLGGQTPYERLLQKTSPAPTPE
jgi:transposase InsO family protein